VGAGGTRRAGQRPHRRQHAGHRPGGAGRGGKAARDDHGAPQPIVLVRGVITESTPKTKTGDRLIWLDAETIRILKEHRAAQLRTRLKAGDRWQDNDLILCKDDGTPFKPDYVTRHFKRLSALAGLPVIKLHEGRHSAASLARDAEVDPEIRRRTLGHADAAMTSHYTPRGRCLEGGWRGGREAGRGGVITHEFSPNVPIEASEGHRTVAVEYRQVAGRAETARVAEADGNRTRQRRGTPLTGFEDQGDRQVPRRLRTRLY
jgi:hypothetical protein